MAEVLLKFYIGVSKQVSEDMYAALEMWQRENRCREIVMQYPKPGSW